MRALFETLPLDVLALRGRITFESKAPFFMTSCDGGAAKLLGTSSSRLVGRRLQGIGLRSCEAFQRVLFKTHAAGHAEVDILMALGEIERALRVCSTQHQRVYTSIMNTKGQRLPVVIQPCESSADHEALIFPECSPWAAAYALLSSRSGTVAEQVRPSSLCGSRIQRNPPCKEIALFAEDVASQIHLHNKLAGLAHDLSRGAEASAARIEHDCEAATSP